jgi:hypothetical protein
MAFTRFNYDPCRTNKLLQEATGTSRYIFNKPGPGSTPSYFEDPHIRLTEWGANLMIPSSGAPIDIASDLDGRTRRATRYCSENKYPKSGVVNSISQTPRYKTQKAFTDETRASHPAWQYRDLEQTRREYPLLNPQENICKPFNNNLSTRILEKDYYIPHCK